MFCYLCGTKNSFFLKKNGYKIYFCNSCKLKQTILKEEINTFIKRYYDEGYFTGKTERVAYVSYAGDQFCINKNASKYLKIIKKFKKRGNFLDIGCAYGFFLELAQKNGFNVHGLDPSHHAVVEAKKRITTIHEGTIHNLKEKKNYYDVITMLDVFEHLADPLKDLKKIYSFLKPGGIILIATGDTECLLAKVQKRRWTFYIPPQHLFFYNKSNLEKILEKSFFKPIYWTKVGKWVSLRYVLHLAKTTGESKLAQLIEPFILKIGLGKLPLFLPVGDNMVVVAQKAEK